MPLDGQDLSQGYRLKTLVSLPLPETHTIFLIICDLVSNSACELTRRNSSHSQRSVCALFNLAHGLPSQSGVYRVKHGRNTRFLFLPLVKRL